MRPYDILVAGEINPDLILSGDVEPDFGEVEKLVDSARLTIGSSSAIFACGVARLGLKVAFTGKCGDDVFGRYMLDEMQKRGVNVENVIVVPGEATGLGVILNRGTERAILTYPGLIPALRAEEIPDELLRQARHLHVGAYYLQVGLQPGLKRLFKRAHSLSLTTSLDTNYDPAETWDSLDDLLEETDVFLPNEAEACALSRTHTVEAAAERLSEQVETLAIKLGAQGALGMSASARLGEADERQIIRVNSIPVDAVDTTGAGDSFDAGFVYGYLQGWTLERCLRAAVICGGLSTRAVGGTSAQATLAEVSALLESD
jgi:sugar/nucleoside kinase (ribokinase family)